ncbi:flagellar hook assembly protein FlgD [Undibacterium sp. TJN25]|uniref:flagellar hook assembly protein FlgD n=1 Tax=Undibacterium sp. TJN25 TaxID=3413056 RepID=UPI003BF13F49
MSTSASPGAAGQVSAINLQDFLKILSSQLTNQDPLKPLDNQEFVAQIAQFSTLEQSTELNAKIDQMLSQQSVTQSIGLIGRTVGVDTSTATSNGSLTGKVTAINYVSGQAQLTVTASDGSLHQGITLAQITSAK